MALPRTYTTEAMVLKHTNMGEADRIVTLYTPGQGKIRAVARGVRRTKSKLGGHVEPLTHCSVILSRGRNLETLTQSQVIESFLPIRNDLTLTAQAMYLIELTDVFTSEHLENYPIYKLLMDALHHLNRTRQVDVFFRYFELHLLDYLGYRPELYECLSCRSRLKPVKNYFAPNSGGVLCPDCARIESGRRPLSVDALKVLRLLQKGDYARANRLRLGADLLAELNGTLQTYICCLLEDRPKSTRFLELLNQDRLLLS